MAKIDRSPESQDQLIDELSQHPRAVNDEENAMLLHRQIDLQNQYGDATRELAHAYDDSKEFPNRLDDLPYLKDRVAAISDKLLQLYDINKFVGTETARGLASRRMLANEDYTLAQMDRSPSAPPTGAKTARRLRAAKRKSADLHERIAKTQKAFDDYVAETQAKISSLEANKAVEEIKKKPSPRVKDMTLTQRDRAAHRASSASAWPMATRVMSLLRFKSSPGCSSSRASRSETP